MQPKSIAAAVLAASLTVGGASHGAPIFNSRTDTMPAVSKSETGGWKFPSLFRQKEAAPPASMFPPAEPAPSVGTKLKNAVTNNPLTRAWGGGEPEVPTRPAPVKQYDPLSLEHPVTPPTSDLILSMAQVREAQGEIDLARQMYQQAITNFPRESKCFREMGHFEDRQGNLPAAESYYRRALLVSPQDAAASNDLGLCLARQGKLQESAAELQRAIQRNPQKALYRNNLATVLMELGDQQGAMQQLLAAHPPAVAYFNMGHLFEKGGQVEAATGHYAEAARIDPNLSAARDAFARLTSTTPVVAANPHAAGHRPQPSTHQLPAIQATPSGPGVAPQAPQVVPPVVAPLPTVPQAPPTASPWPSQGATTVPTRVDHEPSFGPKLLPPVR